MSELRLQGHVSASRFDSELMVGFNFKNRWNQFIVKRGLVQRPNCTKVSGKKSRMKYT